MRINLYTAAVGAVALGAGLIAVSVNAGPDKVAFPQGYEKWERYATVDRYDNKQYRELYAKPEVVKAVREGKPIPDGTVLVMAINSVQLDDKGNPLKGADGRFMKDKLSGITVMEKRRGFGTEYPDNVRNGDWEYAAFLPDGKPNEKTNANTTPCFACHKPHEKQDYVISLASLSGKSPMVKTAAMKKGANDVNIGSFSFGPSPIKVKKGQTITWTNTDDSPHQVTVVDKPLKTAVLLKGQSASLTFADAGTHSYNCALHPGMKGMVEVTE